jgi:hypothetical protein
LISGISNQKEDGVQLSLFGLGAAATKSVRTSVEISLDSAPADYTPVYPAYGLRQAALFVLMKYGENAVLSQLVAMIDCLPSNEYLLALSTMQYKIFERYGLIHGVRLIRFAVSTSGISEVVQFDDPQIQPVTASSIGPIDAGAAVVLLQKECAKLKEQLRLADLPAGVRLVMGTQKTYQFPLSDFPEGEVNVELLLNHGGEVLGKLMHHYQRILRRRDVSPVRGKPVCVTRLTNHYYVYTDGHGWESAASYRQAFEVQRRALDGRRRAAGLPVNSAGRRKATLEAVTQDVNAAAQKLRDPNRFIAVAWVQGDDRRPSHRGCIFRRHSDGALSRPLQPYRITTRLQLPRFTGVK